MRPRLEVWVVVVCVVVGLGVWWIGGGAATLAGHPPLRVNPVAVENRLAGTGAWRIVPAPGGAIAGYASEVSVAPGDSLLLHVATSRKRRYRVLVYRIGWYGGTGGRLVTCVPGCRRDDVGVSRPVPS